MIVVMAVPLGLFVSEEARTQLPLSAATDAESAASVLNGGDEATVTLSACGSDVSRLPTYGQCWDATPATQISVNCAGVGAVLGMAIGAPGVLTAVLGGAAGAFIGGAFCMLWYNYQADSDWEDSAHAWCNWQITNHSTPLERDHQFDLFCTADGEARMPVFEQHFGPRFWDQPISDSR